MASGSLAPKFDLNPLTSGEQSADDSTFKPDYFRRLTQDYSV
jgi:hypothetical protein